MASTTRTDDNPDLSSIYIRAKVDEKWESISLQELIDKGLIDVAMDWCKEKLWRALELEEAAPLEKRHIQNFVALLDYIGVPIARLKQ